jgi:2,4-dienoyl-CoA reductase-like NADH-dependent reductase (Old Yellow Enzyme family)/thioredoxin reductase
MPLNKYPHVYQPIQVGNMTLKNRIQYSPIVSNHADYVTGRVTNELLEFVGTQAKSGAGLVTIGSTPIDFDRGRDFYGCLSVTSDDDAAGLYLLTREVHHHDCKLSAELTHGGQWAAERSLGGREAFVPSVVRGIHDPKKYKEITRSEMLEVIDHWIDATKRCMRTGFDMVMVHMAHGNLLSSFLSTAFNQRTDQYGGSPENRWRYPLEVLEAVHSVTRGKIPIEVRIVGDERIPGGTPLSERIAFLKEAQKYIDMIVVSTGTLFMGDAFSYNMPGYYTPPMLNVPVAAEMKKALNIPVSVVGGISTLEEAEEIIASGKADIVAMAKALMADPEFVTKGYRGLDKDIRPCMRCLYCLRNVEAEAHLDGCAVNPRMGWEYRYPQELPLAAKRKNVMIIGGGPGGMEAARILTARGHNVKLFEMEDKLGGHLPEASALVYKDGFRRYYDYTVRKTMACGARIVLGKPADEETIRAEAPDVLIIAIGAKPVLPPLEGIDLPNVHGVAAVDRGEVSLGKKVVVCGAGLSGTECALGLALEGKDVTLVDMRPKEELCSEMVFFMKPLLQRKLEENNVKTLDRHTVLKFTAGGVMAKNAAGSEVLVEADDIILAFGLKPDKEELERFSQIVPETYIIGDAKKVGLIGDAVTEAYRVCREI